MKAIFLSDAHLYLSRDAGYRSLVNFLGRLEGPAAGLRGSETGEAMAARASLPVTDLFLVGDLFDFWFSRNERIYPEFEELVNKLKHLKKQGIAIHLSEGNHDFFLKGFFTDVLGMTVYEDWAVIHPDGKKILVAHGDLVDGSNTAYLRLRKFLRSPLIFRLQRLLPLGLLWGIARFSSSMSKEYMGGGKSRIVEIMRQFAEEQFRDGFDAVILGHCHAPHLTESVVDGKKRIFVTLGDWISHHTYLYYAGGRFALERFEE